jgi:hypothetical protein
MTKRDELMEDDEAIESILRSAPPRPAPSAADVAEARSAVHDEWLALYGRRRERHNLLWLAAAAAIVCAVAAGLFMLRVPSALPEQVATVERSAGTIYLLGEQSVLDEVPGLAELMAGQTLVTGQDAGLALSWLGGGSLRIDADSRIEFLSAREVFLHDGQVYFDSLAGADFAVRTDDGVIRHVGTQYMASVTASGVTVSVREGKVRILADTFDATAVSGQQVRVQGGARPEYANVRTYGKLWHWAEMFTPTIDVDGQSAHQFIRWAARESGLDVRFANAEVEALAHGTHMSGNTGELEPRVALHALLQTTTLEAAFVDNSILVSER